MITLAIDTSTLHGSVALLREDELLFEIAKHLGADTIVRKPRPEETWIGTLRQLLPERIRDIQPGI